MRRIGAHVSSAGGPSNAIKNIVAIGGNCLQIFAGSPRMWSRKIYDPQEVDKFDKLAKTNDINPTFIHALYLVNLGSDNPDILKKSFDALLTDLKNGDLINAAGVIIHVGSHQGRGFDSVKDQIVNQINTLLSQTEKTPIIIENSAGQQGKIGTSEEISTLLKEINHPRIKVCIDTAHLFESGCDITNKSELEKYIDQLEKLEILPHINCLHLNDSKTKLNSKHDQHHNLGEGFIGLESLANFANHPKLKHLPIILEVPGFDNKGPDAKNITIARSVID